MARMRQEQEWQLAALNEKRRNAAHSKRFAPENTFTQPGALRTDAPYPYLRLSRHKS